MNENITMLLGPIIMTLHLWCEVHGLEDFCLSDVWCKQCENEKD